MFKLKEKYSSDLILVLSAILLLILGGAVVFWSSIKNQNNSNVSQFLKPNILGKASLTIDFGNKNKRSFEGDIIENETLIDVLNQTSRAGGLSFKLNEKGDLVSINNSVNSSKKFWRWYLNGEKINKQPGKIIVKTGDNILIKYE